MAMLTPSCAQELQREAAHWHTILHCQVQGVMAPPGIAIWCGVVSCNVMPLLLSCAGTVAYMAPEVLQKGAMAMPADVYSFAMLMLELWTGEIVYSGINSHQVALRQALPARLRLPKRAFP